MGAPGNIVRSGGAAGATGGAARSDPTLDAARKARLQKAVKDFEAIFLGMMMKSMRSSVPKDEGAGDSFGGDIMESMFDEEVARQMAGRSNLGLADMLYRSITHEPMPGTAAAAPGKLVPAAAVPHAAAVSPAGHTQEAARAPAAPARNAPAAETPAAPSAHAKKPAAAAPGPVTGPPASVRERIAAYEDLIQEAAAYHGVDSTVIKAVIAAESGGDRTAVSPKDAKGLMQLTDSTAVDMGVRNVWDARDNIQGGARYLQSLLERFDGDTKNAIASYNAGPARVERHGGVPPIPETQAYVRRVMNYIHFFEQEESSNEGR